MADFDKEISTEEEYASARKSEEESESGGGSNDQQQPVAIADEGELLNVLIHGDDDLITEPSNDDEWLLSITTKIGKSSSSDNTMQKHEIQIQKVPQMLRQTEHSKDYYDPEVVSIGPYHHHNPKLKSFEEFKIQFTGEYVGSCNPPSITVLYNKVAEVAGEARNCYAEGSTKEFDDRAFARMMFLDGCFILQYIYYISPINYEKRAKMKMKSHDVAFVKRDLFLLENQLPFKVLQALMSMNSNFVGDKGMRLINEFITTTRASRSPPQDSFKEKVENFITKHITQPIIRRRRHWHWHWHWRAGSSSSTAEESLSKGEPAAAHLLELMHRQLIDPNAFTFVTEFGEGEGGGVCSCYSFRSVQELKAAGIHFRANKYSTSFTDARYEHQIVKAILRLPTMTIDDSTQSLLLNLVAYEMCPDSPNDYGVNSYIWFMDTLIHDAEDVKELSRKGVLVNYFGSDQQVANLFTETARNVVPNPHAYVSVKNDIEKHYGDKVSLWIITWLHTHFSTPWTVFGFLAATFQITLTFIHAYFSYYHRTGRNE